MMALGVDERRAAWLWRMCLRTLFVLFTYGVSVLCRDSFPPLLDLVSSLTSAPTMFLCPCAFYIKLSHMVGRPVSRSMMALGVDERRAAWLWRMCLRTLFVLFTYGVSVLCRDSFPPLLDL